MLQVKVDGPTIEEFYAKHRDKAVPLYYNDQNCTMQQPQRKTHKMRETKINRNRIAKFYLEIDLKRF